MTYTGASLAAAVRLRWPALDVEIIDDAALLAWLTWAQAFVGVEFACAGLEVEALIHLLAHKAYRSPSVAAALGTPGEIPGAIASQSAGGLSVAYASSPAARGDGGNADTDLAATEPGRSYLALRDTLPLGWTGW